MANLGQDFYKQLVNMTSEVGMNPEDLLLIMTSESGINPSSHNKNGGASGLIQIMPSTLKHTGFKGDPAAFRSLSGAEQLPYIKNLIKSSMSFNGGPFKSAAQYYVANFYPVALKLPGIKNEDVSTKFIEQNPEIAVVNGKEYSKKYVDVGFRIPASGERAAFEANKGFAKTNKDSITYGDIVNQINKNKQNPLYKQALEILKAQANYIPTIEIVGDPEKKTLKNDKPKSEVKDLKPKFEDLKKTSPKVKEESIEDVLERYMSKSAITLNSDKIITAEYCRVLNNILAQDYNIKSNIFAKDDKIEIVCDSIKGLNLIANECANQLSKVVNADLKVSLGKQSVFRDITFNEADSNYRLFLVKFGK